MKRLLRENRMLTASIVLPLLVVVLFALASVLPRMYTSPPAHDLLLIQDSRGASRQIPVGLNLNVLDGRVVATVIKEEYVQGTVPRIFLYEHAAGAVREINIPIPSNIGELSYGSVIEIPELSDLSVSNTLRAPDGYEYRGHSRGGGVITGLFGSSQNRNDVAISKDGAIVRIRLPTSGYWYNEMQFLGWVL